VCHVLDARSRRRSALLIDDDRLEGLASAELATDRTWLRDGPLGRSSTRTDDAVGP